MAATKELAKIAREIASRTGKSVRIGKCASCGERDILCNDSDFWKVCGTCRFAEISAQMASEQEAERGYEKMLDRWASDQTYLEERYSCYVS